MTLPMTKRPSKEIAAILRKVTAHSKTPNLLTAVANRIDAQAAEIARLRGVLEHGLKECARETIRAEAAEVEIARLRDALRNSAAILQAACNSKRLHEGDSFRIGGVYLQTIGDTLDQSNKALAALEPKP